MDFLLEQMSRRLKMTEKQKNYIEWIEGWVDISFAESGMSISEYINTYKDEAEFNEELYGIYLEYELDKD